MFCNQCEQTAKGKGCDTMCVCGKTPEVAALQDLLTHSVKGLSLLVHAGRKVGVVDSEVNRFSCEAIFSTLSNVDFDPARFVAMIERCDQLKDGSKFDGKIKLFF
jgi:hydroxylamine reductase